MAKTTSFDMDISTGWLFINSLTCISCIFSSSSGDIPSCPPITVSRSRLFLLLPVTDTVTRTGLMATAAAAVRRAIPARGAMRSARGLALLLLPPFLSDAEMYRVYQKMSPFFNRLVQNGDNILGHNTGMFRDDNC